MSDPSRKLHGVIVNLDVVAYGRPASAALASAVRAAKADRALAPVTVIVPSNLAGLSARRLMGASSGVVNVSFLTAATLARQLAADQLLHLHPLTTPVLGAAVRRTLAEAPGPFASVRDHMATEVALASLHTHLADLDHGTLDRMLLDGGRSAAVAIGLHRRIASHLTDTHDDAALARAATSRPDLAAAVEPLGHVVWHLPQPLPAPLLGLVSAVLAERPSTAVVGLTGAPEADEPVRRACRAAGVTLPTEAPTIEAPTASDIVSVTDADEEVRSVVRRVVALAEDGVRLDRIAIFHPTPHPYVGLLHQQLAAAGIPANGPSRRRLSESVAGRTLLAALDLPAQNWSRDRVMALVSGAPVRHTNGTATHPAAWETLSRDAGVVGGLADWRSKLAGHRGFLERRSRPDEPDTARVLSDIDGLASFVADLAAATGEVRAASGWGERCDAAHRLLVGLLRPGHLHTGWPVHEQVAFERVEDALVRLATLDDVEPEASIEVFSRALRIELDVPQPRSGRYGEGVLYGPLGSAVGHDLEAVFVLGCVEGLLPAARRDDSLLPDSVRRLADGQLELRADRLHHQHRAFLAALAGAPEQRRVLTMSRSDLRGSRHSQPSRWLLDSASALAGHTVHSTDFALLDVAGVHTVPSYASSLLSTPVAATVGERDLAAVARAVERGADAADHPAAAGVLRGLEAQRARRSERFTEWDGNLAGLPVERAGDRPWSATRLETWASCGLRYFFRYVLGLDDRADPERILDIDPLDRGSALHRILELFIADHLGSDAPHPSQAWSAPHFDRLIEIAVEVLDEYQRRGRTGRALHWQLSGQSMVDTLVAFLLQDNEHRAATGTRPAHVEFGFGRHAAPPVLLRLGDDREVAFSGAVDRIDVDDAGVAHVSDYKTGKGEAYKGLEADVVLGGTTLQLGLYAEAALQHAGATAVDSRYWIIHPERRYRQRYGYPWTPERRQRFIDVVGAIVEGIDRGTFPAEPGEWSTFRNTHENCKYCSFDPICPRDRGEQRSAKAAAVELRVRDALVAPS